MNDPPLVPVNFSHFLYTRLELLENLLSYVWHSLFVYLCFLKVFQVHLVHRVHQDYKAHEVRFFSSLRLFCQFLAIFFSAFIFATE